MASRIEQFQFEPLCDCPPDVVGYDKEAHMNEVHVPITYWDVYLDDHRISTASSKEQAEKTREWTEKWLAGDV